MRAVRPEEPMEVGLRDVELTIARAQQILRQKGGAWRTVLHEAAREIAAERLLMPGPILGAILRLRRDAFNEPPKQGA